VLTFTPNTLFHAHTVMLTQRQAYTNIYIFAFLHFGVINFKNTLRMAKRFPKKKCQKVTFLLKVMKKVQLASSWNKHTLHHDCCNRKSAWTRYWRRGKKTWSVTISLNMLYHMQKLFSTESDCYINMTAQIP